MAIERRHRENCFDAQQYKAPLQASAAQVAKTTLKTFAHISIIVIIPYSYWMPDNNLKLAKHKKQQAYYAYLVDLKTRKKPNKN